jgi:hypothetical protein
MSSKVFFGYAYSANEGRWPNWTCPPWGCPIKTAHTNVGGGYIPLERERKSWLVTNAHEKVDFSLG